MREDYDVIIIGAGITGLISAYELTKRGKSVAVFEKTDYIGGAIRPFKEDGMWLEGFYHHLFKGDSVIFELAKELDAEITWHTSKIAFHYLPDDIYNFSSPADLFRFRKLSMRERIKLGKFLAGVYWPVNADRLASISAKDWIISKVGGLPYRVFFEPMLNAKFGEYLEEIGADWFLGRLKMRSSRTWRGERLGYFKGGFGSFTERLREKIEESGGRVFLGSEVSNIITESGHAIGVSLNKGRKFYSRYVLSTVPPEVLLKLADFTGEYRDKIRKLEYQGTICVLLATRSKVTDYYWINMMNKTLRFSALIEHTNFQNPSQYGRHIIYLASYPGKDSALWNLSDNELLKEYLKSFKESFPRFSDDLVEWAKVFRSDAAGLVYRIGIRQNLPDIQTPIRNLFIGGMLNAYPKRSIDTCARIAARCAEKMAL